MKQFMILHYGFRPPTPEEMDAWHRWFDLVAGRQVDRGGLRGGREILPTETRELPFAADSITGYTIIQAESLDEAEEIARQCPIVASTRVYEIAR
ncbi:MAG: hypothetical protein D6784_06245 [Chloroflexi bacterium]|nr:MAG: hypothetical protein D6784_06245 [Chloroflexota bacterium]